MFINILRSRSLQQQSSSSSKKARASHSKRRVVKRFARKRPTVSLMWDSVWSSWTAKLTKINSPTVGQVFSWQSLLGVITFRPGTHAGGTLTEKKLFILLIKSSTVREGEAETTGRKTPRDPREISWRDGARTCGAPFHSLMKKTNKNWPKSRKRQRRRRRRREKPSWPPFSLFLFY